MAIRPININRTNSTDGASIQVSWTNLTFSGLDTGSPLSYSAWNERTVHVFGTFGVGGTVSIEGSNDGTNWAPVANRAGAAMTFTTPGLNRVQDYPLYLRPRITAGDGTTSLSVFIAAHKFALNEKN